MTTIVYIHEPLYIPKVALTRNLGAGLVSIHGNYSAQPPLWPAQQRQFANDHDAGRAYLADYCGMIAHVMVPMEVTRIVVECPCGCESPGSEGST